MRAPILYNPGIDAKRQEIAIRVDISDSVEHVFSREGNNTRDGMLKPTTPTWPLEINVWIHVGMGMGMEMEMGMAPSP